MQTIVGIGSADSYSLFRRPLGLILPLFGIGCLEALFEGCLEVLSLEFSEHGCCLWVVILSIAMTGTISGLLIGHALFTKAGMALARVILFVGLASKSRNEEAFDR
jgi:hypothetical protein